MNWNNLRSTLDRPASTYNDRSRPRPLRGRACHGKTVCFTSVTRKYLPKAFIFASTLKSIHPSIEYHVVVNDSWDDLLI